MPDKQPTLTGTKVFLRPLEGADVNATYLGWLNDPEVTHWLEVGRSSSTEKTLRTYLARFKGSDTDLIFAICDLKTGAHIGNVTLNHINPVDTTADSGIMIGAKEYWGKGYGHEAWSLLLDYALNKLGLRKIVAGAMADNTASLRLQEKLGFKLEGTFREEVYIDAAYHDVVRTGLFARDFKPLTK